MADRKLDPDDLLWTPYESYGRANIPLSGTQTGAWLDAFNVARDQMQLSRRRSGSPRVDVVLKHDAIEVEGPLGMTKQQSADLASDLEGLVQAANSAAHTDA